MAALHTARAAVESGQLDPNELEILFDDDAEHGGTQSGPSDLAAAMELVADFQPSAREAHWYNLRRAT